MEWANFSDSRGLAVQAGSFDFLKLIDCPTLALFVRVRELELFSELLVGVQHRLLSSIRWE